MRVTREFRFDFVRFNASDITVALLLAGCSALRDHNVRYRGRKMVSRAQDMTTGLSISIDACLNLTCG